VRRRERDALAAWSLDLIDRHGDAVAAIVGLDRPLPQIDVAVSRAPGVASTSGTTITLHASWFAQHPDDAGCVVHELSHAYLRAPEYSERTAWLIEGIGDHTRDELGMATSWSFAHHERGKAMAGYQTTAHFLAWLEGWRPGAVAALGRRLHAGTYDEGAFGEIAERPLEELVAAYEAAFAG